ncbi:MAG TPA: PIG-L deacetylase family protein [Acidimicrobiia bacterium]|nr:PIG-L deacetylase family protein [Acidimicrobiia bacterium]
MNATVNLPVPDRALAIGAHPDDIEFGAGATLAKWAAAGCEVHLLVLTDGSKGSWEVDDDTAALVETRHAEARAAVRELGAAEVHFLDEVDGELREGVALRRKVSRVIRLTRPSVVLGHDPWKRYRLHPDHRHAGFLTVDGVVAARDPHFDRDLGVVHHRPDVLLLFEADEPNHAEDVAGWLDRKVAALLAHRSQWRSTMGIHDDPDTQLAAFRQQIEDEAAEAGRLAGLAAGEAFRRIDDV